VAEQEKPHEITLPGKYTEIEETILIWLYDHPGHDASTDTFTKMFNPDLKMYGVSEELQEALETTRRCKVLGCLHSLDKWRDGPGSPQPTARTSSSKPIIEKLQIT
jgi:hypothetical protein